MPSLFKPGSNDRAEATAQFPTFPPRFVEGADEYYAGSEFDDRFDAFHAARAWFTYANTMVPPAKQDENGDPLPWATPQPGEYDPFRYRVPRQPTLIIFKCSPPRAQTYLAERLAKEGWFDDASAWSPDDRSGAGAWFGSAAAGEVALKAGTNSRTEYDRAWGMWDSAGRSWGLVVEPSRLAALNEKSRRLPFPPGGLPPELSPEEMSAAGISLADMTARKALVYYDQNRQMTNFPFFLDSTLAEKDELTVRARRVLFEADQARQAAENSRAVRLYTEGLAQWREVLAKHPRFHRGNGDLVEEQTYEFELALVNLLKEEGAVRARADRAVDALRALVPAGADLDTGRADLLQAFAEDEAAVRVVTEQMATTFPRLAGGSPEGQAVRRVGQTADAVSAVVGPVALTATGRLPVTRGLIDAEYRWMKVSGKEPPPFGGGLVDNPTVSPDDYWVRPHVRDSVRTRLGLVRPSTATPQSDPAATTTEGQPAGP